MTRAKKTEGEKIATNYATGMHPLEGRGLAVTIDRAIRRAWLRGAKFGIDNPQFKFKGDTSSLATWNPYRKAKL